MSNEVKQIIRKTVLEMAGHGMSSRNIRKMAEKPAEKVHFVTTRYRMIGGILQSVRYVIKPSPRNMVEIHPPS